jgi:hypothetical protein
VAQLLRTTLRALGHDVSGWSLGTNRGPTSRVVHTLRAHLERLHRASGRRVSLVGWSLGGLYAQLLARAAPGSVRGLVTLGTPVVRWAPWVRTASGIVDGGTRLLRGAAALPRPWAERGSLRVPPTSVYTRADGIVPWSSCRYEADSPVAQCGPDRCGTQPVVNARPCQRAHCACHRGFSTVACWSRGATCLRMPTGRASGSTSGVRQRRCR